MPRRSLLGVQRSTAAPEPGGPVVLLNTSFANGSFSQFRSCQWTGRNDNCQGYNGVDDYSATVVELDGRPHVARFEVRDGDVPPFGGSERSEIAEATNAEIFEGDEVWLALDIKFPADFPTPVVDWHTVTQLHPNSGTASPTLTLDVGMDDNLYLTNDEPTSEPDRTEIGPIVRGSWVRYLVHFKAATSSDDGWGEVYQDGELVVAQHPRATVLDGGAHYWKWGIYRHSNHTATSVVYFDNIKLSVHRPTGGGGTGQSPAYKSHSTAAVSQGDSSVSVPAPSSGSTGETQAARFDNSGEHFSVALSPPLETEFTILCWARVAVDRDSFTTIWGLDDGDSDSAVALQTLSDGISLQLGSEGGAFTELLEMAAETWYCFAVVRSALTGADGVVSYHGTNPSALTPMSHEPDGQLAHASYSRFLLGESSWGGEWLNGNVAGVRVYSRSLSASEVASELASPTPVSTSGLYASWTFDGTPVTADGSGNGHSLTGGTGATVEAGPTLASSGIVISESDYQFVMLAIASSSADVPITDPAGWVRRGNIVVQSPPSASGTSRFALYEIHPDATLTQRRAAFALTLTSGRVWAAVRGCYTLPVGSTGRTVAIQSKAEVEGAASTSHSLPTVTTTAPNSLVIGLGGSDQYSGLYPSQAWPAAGLMTQRVNYTGPNTTEIVAVAMADQVVLTATSGVGGTLTTSTPDECGLFTVVLNGT